MSAKKETRRAVSFAAQQRDGKGMDGEHVSVSPSAANNSFFAKAAQRGQRSQDERRRRRRESRRPTERQRGQRQAAQSFAKLQGVVRRV